MKEMLEKEDKDQYLMSSVYNTLEVLDFLSHHEEMGVAEISKALGLGKASVFRMLYTLEKKNYVYKTSDAKYRLGIKFAHYGTIVLEKLNLISLIKPYLEKLRDKYNETVHLGIVDDDLNVIFIAKESSTSTIQMTSRVGSKMPFYATATGKAIIAYKLDEEMEKKIRLHNLVKFTETTVTDHDEFIELLKQVKNQGFGEDLEESEVGLTCFAVPVRDISGNVIAGISMSGPTARMEKNKEVLLSSLKVTAKEVSRAMGYIEKYSDVENKSIKN